ncbi:uncharacterized protein LY89DRAFT_116253 [Mollisia scopiformis]|uniref:Uncharacterized protein n=1 Tax=Mollisia scopiformis TaxID=149040 RepID=A0A194X5T4_MOLSC|nr:uncharacterized protein LY89DRAFT_116253 [Mollisia scopiformis]KUJ15538.1 hypothetical protein LY89DRAFT_116253 [Mollisia scopiformis]
MSRGSDLSYKHVGVLRTNASDKIVPDTRDYKNQGFSYPVAVQVGNTLVTAYSENKENIWRYLSYHLTIALHSHFNIQAEGIRRLRYVHFLS